MNYITHEAFNTFLKRAEKQSGLTTAEAKKLIKTEIITFLGKENFKNGVYQGGTNKEELLSYLEEFKNNSLNKIIIATIEELFGSNSFQNGKFTGG